MLNAVFFFATNFKRKCRPKNHLIRVVCLCTICVCVFVIEGRFRAHVRPVCALILALYMLYIPIGFESSSLCVTWLMECYICASGGEMDLLQHPTLKQRASLSVFWFLGARRAWRASGFGPNGTYTLAVTETCARIKVEDRRAQYTDAGMARGKDLQDN